jgi:uncharacterized protein YllA (UPF0747 family)
VRLFVFLSILFCSGHAFADLRQALNDFENGCILHKEISALKHTYDTYAAKPEDEKGHIAKLKKAFTEKIQAAEKKLEKNGLQTAADEFMRLRKRGSTIPIAYLEYLQKEKLADIREPIRWELSYFEQMQKWRERTLASS